MRRPLRIWALVALLVAASLLPACRSRECAKMMQCCREVRDVEGVGAACGPLAEKVREADKCASILESIQYLFIEKGRELPEVCRLAEDDEK